jgi:hypothetical protein
MSRAPAFHNGNKKGHLNFRRPYLLVASPITPFGVIVVPLEKRGVQDTGLSRRQ